LLGVNVNVSFVSSTLDLKSWLSLTTVWGMSSALVHVICVPAFTVSVAGVKLKLSILTLTVGGSAAIDFGTVSAAKDSTVDAAIQRIHLLFLSLLLRSLLSIACSL
jgi:hypothetical protein